jgi:hypothetical protein
MLLDFAAIKANCPLHDLLSFIGWRPLRSYNGQERGKCPLHASNRSRSYSFAVQGDRWYCHRCKVGGDVFELWGRIYHQAPYKAAVELCKTLGRPIFYQRGS